MNNIDVKILITSKQYLKWSFRPTFKRENNFLMEEQLSKKKCIINPNKPTYIGTSRLVLSKVLMQNFHYNYIENQYDDKAEMLLTDTGSLMNKIKAENG